MTASPTETSAARLAGTAPALTGAGRLDGAIGMPPRTLLHAGPPYRAPGEAPAVVRNAAAAAAVAEGWASDLDAGRGMVAAGEIALAPAQDHGLVVPLAFVAGPSTAVMTVRCARTGATGRAPVNDGPPAGSTRFGAPDGAAAGRLSWLSAAAAPALNAVLADAPIDLLPIAAAALAAGDELHASVGAGNALLIDRLGSRLGPGEVRTYVEGAQQFFLNVWMAAAACMLAAGAGVSGSALMAGAGANGVRVGLRLAGAPGRWIERRAAAPAGPPLAPALAGMTAAPAVGDSAVIEAAGFGALAARFAPAVREAFVPFCPAAYRADGALAVADHPAFAELGLRLGVDAARLGPERPLPAHFAMLDAAGTAGLIGRGALVLTAEALA